MRVDIMTDIETLGTKPNSTVFQVSAVAFDITTGLARDSFNQIIDVSKEDLIADGNTIKWWLNTDKELLTKLINNENALSSKIVFENFRNWILSQAEDSKNICLWGNGIKFDNVMIDAQMRKYDLEYPIFYRNDRDVRTILELASFKSNLTEEQIKQLATNKNETKHDAFDDCIYQIRLVKKCWDILMNDYIEL